MFSLRFSESKIKDSATRNTGDLSSMLQIGRDVKKRGYITRPEFLKICEGKTQRTKKRCALNSEEYIREITQVSFATSQEQLRIQILTLLNGVSWPTASFLLHFCSSDPYPIIDFRALWLLKVSASIKYDFNFWWSYTEYCRRLANRNDISMRTLDSALWQYSNEKQK